MRNRTIVLTLATLVVIAGTMGGPALISWVRSERVSAASLETDNTAGTWANWIAAAYPGPAPYPGAKVFLPMILNAIVSQGDVATPTPPPTPTATPTPTPSPTPPPYPLNISP